MLSTDGYVVYNDGDNQVYEADGWWGSGVHRNTGPTPGQDLYIFMYKDQYRTALADLSKLVGPQPVCPLSSYHN